MSITTPMSPAPIQPGRSTGWIAATVIAAVLAVVGMLAAVVMAVAGPELSHNTTASSSTISHHTHSSVTPSNAIKLEQEQLGRLNYYEGPINGYDTQATINAISYLQRDAGLPQTGQMNAATQAALTQMLITGNNHMAG